MKFRSAAMLALVLASTAAVPAHAAKVVKVCNLITDAAGDTFVARQVEGNANNPQEQGLDLTSADIASDGKTITAVIRLKKYSTAIQTAPEGFGVAYSFLIPTSDLTLQLRAVFITGQPAVYEATSRDENIPNSPSTYLGAATGSIVAAKNEIHISAPVSVFASVGPIKKGTKLSPNDDQSASTGRAAPPSPGVADKPVATRFVYADVANGKGYVVGTPSCVTPGK